MLLNQSIVLIQISGALITYVKTNILFTLALQNDDLYWHDTFHTHIGEDWALVSNTDTKTNKNQYFIHLSIAKQ